MIVAARTATERRAAGCVTGGDPRENRERSGDAPRLPLLTTEPGGGPTMRLIWSPTVSHVGDHVMATM